MTLLVEEIDVPPSHRPCNAETVSRLAASIKEIGLQHAITVRSNKATARFDLIAGGHRLEACKMLRFDRLPCRIVKMDDVDARMWEISENLHRAELTALERSEQIAEYAQLAKKKREGVSRQVDAKPLGGRPEGGSRAAARDLGLSEPAVRRAEEIANITPEAKAAITDAGLNDNQAALLRVAKAPDQVAAVRFEEARKANAEQDRAIAYTEAQQFADWLMARIDLHEIDRLVSWLECCKSSDVIKALRREAA